MQTTISMPRLINLAARNRNSGLKVLFATAMLLAGSALASAAALVSLSTIL